MKRERFAEVEAAIDILLMPVRRASLTTVRTTAPEVEGSGSNTEVFEAASGMVPSAVSISPAQMAAVPEAPAVEASQTIRCDKLKSYEHSHRALQNIEKHSDQRKGKVG